MATTYQYLISPFIGFQTKSGSLNTNGVIRVYDAATDDSYVTYSDFSGTENPESIRLDDNGRAIIIADDSRAYRVEVYDRYNALQYTVSPVFARGGGGGTLSNIDIVSTDHSVRVASESAGGIKTFDLGISKTDPEYIVCTGSAVVGQGDGAGYLVPAVLEDGTMTLDSNGILLHGGQHYHVDAWVAVNADADLGDPDNEYRTREMLLKFRLLSTAGDPVEMSFDNSYAHCETCVISGDLHPPRDTYLKVYFDGYDWANYAQGEIQSPNVSLTRVSVHSIVGCYVPDIEQPVIETVVV